MVDNTAPTVTIGGVPDPSSAAFTATFTFSEDVTGFDVGDIGLGNATASNFTRTNARVYTALITPAADGTVTVDVDASEAEDEAGNANTAATRASSTYTAPLVDTTAAGIRLSTPSLTVSEGRCRSYTVQLNTQPESDVTVNLYNHAQTTDQGNVGVTDSGSNELRELAFTSSSWNRPQTVTVCAPHDEDAGDGRGREDHSQRLGRQPAATTTARWRMWTCR